MAVTSVAPRTFELIDGAAEDAENQAAARLHVDRILFVLTHAGDMASRLEPTVPLEDRLAILEGLAKLARNMGGSLLLGEAQSPVEDRFRRLQTVDYERVGDFIQTANDLPLWKRSEVSVNDHTYKAVTRRFTTPIDEQSLDIRPNRSDLFIVLKESEASIATPEFEVPDMDLVDELERQVAPIEAVADELWEAQFTDIQKDVISGLFAYMGKKGHYQAIARDLGVHRKSISYNLRRIMEITGADNEVVVMQTALEKRLIPSDVVRKGETKDLDEEQLKLLAVWEKWGATKVEIASRMSMHRHTLRERFSPILEKTGAETPTEAALMAYMDGRLPQPD